MQYFIEPGIPGFFYFSSPSLYSINGRFSAKSRKRFPREQVHSNHTFRETNDSLSKAVLNPPNVYTVKLELPFFFIPFHLERFSSTISQ